MKKIIYLALLFLISCDRDNNTIITNSILSTDRDSISTHQDPSTKDSIIIPITEVLMSCLDRVSIGDNLQTVIRNQLQYDSLKYVRFQKPLDDYWNANFPSVLASIKQSRPGLSDSQYDSIARYIMYSVAPFRGTDTCSQTSIDFSKFTLLGQYAATGGCISPTYQMYVCSFDSMKTVVYKLHVIRHGGCDAAFLRNKWVLIPRISDSCKVIFEKDYDWQQN